MDGAVIVKVVIMALILVLVIVTICTCNKFMVLKTRAENQASQIDIQLARRADLIPNAGRSDSESCGDCERVCKA